MEVVILGGDGFCGWPTALKFAAEGHPVTIVDNLSRRKIDVDLGSNSITDIAPIQDRILVANKLIGKIDFINLDIASNPHELRELIGRIQPDTVIHFAEQRAAPFSMISDRERRYTVDNNITGTHNLCSAIVDVSPHTHLVHLGTMGVYGYTEAFGKIPEGYLNVRINETEADTSILYPANPGSIYHMTKCLDQLIFQFYNKNWGLRITDLHQGIVWGINTPETSLAPELINRFDYDGLYGTVLNRFIMQAASGLPLSVYGTGGQSRAFIHISDTTRCVYLAATNVQAKFKKVRIFNQVSEVRSVLELAKLLQTATKCSINYLENPRKELAENELYVSNQGLTSLGFEPITLNERLIDDVRVVSQQNLNNLKVENVNNSPVW